MATTRWIFEQINFAYARQDTVNLAMKGLDMLAPKEIDIIAEATTRQVINDSGQQIQKIAPQIIQGAIEDIYKTPFRLFGQLGKHKFSQLKKKLSRLIKK